MKKKIAGALAVLLLIPIFGACGNTPSGSSSQAGPAASPSGPDPADSLPETESAEHTDNSPSSPPPESRQTAAVPSTSSAQSGKTSVPAGPSSSAAASSETSAAALINPVLTDNAKALGVTQEMLDRAMISAGNQVRIANAMRKAQRGAPVTIGVIGGSISQGAVASAANKRYVNLIHKWWKDTFPKSEVTLVNAAIGSTDSVIAVHRLDQDLLRHKPDFVIVEFAANDSEGDQWAMAYENLLRRILQSENQPGVLMMFMMYNDGKTQQKNEIPLGRHYALPMVSYNDAVMPEIKSGRIKWSDLSPDIVHPNDRGMAIAAELIKAYLASVHTRLADIGYRPPALPAYTADYFTQFRDAKLLHSGNCTPAALGSFKVDFGVLKPHYPLLEEAWTSTGGTSPLVFDQVEGSQIYLLYKKSSDADGGKMKVTIDGSIVKTIDTKYTGGLYAPYEALVLDSTPKTHRIEIELTSGSNTKVSILGLMVSSGK